MGMFVNDKGQLDFKKSEGSSVIGDAIKGAAKTAAVGVGVGVGVTGAAAAVSAGGTTAAAAIGGGAVTVALANEAMKQNGGETVAKAQLEDAHGGIPYEKVMQQYTTATNESAQIAQQELITQGGPEQMDPFEAFRQSMQHAGFTNTIEVNTDTSCLPQNQARQSQMSLSKL